MKTLKVLLLFIFLVSSNIHAYDKHDNQTLKFTQEELNWIKEHPLIRAANEYWPPFDYSEYDKPKGLSIDHMNLLAHKIGIKIKYINGYSWNELLELFKDKKVDVLPAYYKSIEREKFSLFSKPYYSGKLGILTQKNRNISIDDLAKLKVAMIKGEASIPMIKKKIPNINIIEIDTDKQMAKQLSEGKIDAIIGSPLVLFFTAKEEQITNISLLNHVEMTQEEQSNISLHIGIRKDWPILHQIIQKAMANTTNEEFSRIEKKWIFINDVKEFDYTLIWQILGVIIAILLIIIYRQIILRKHNILLKATEKKLNDLTIELEHRVKDEIKKNQEKTNQLIQQSKLAQMGEMISMIAHQWRQPLTAITATANTISLQVHLYDKISNKELLEEVKLISEYSQHLSSTIDDFRNFYKPNKTKEYVSFAEVVDKTINIIYSSYEEKSIKLVKNYMSKEKFDTYPSQLSQVILNLLKNAEDVLLEKNKKNPKVIINTYCTEDSCILEICDNGGGIKKEYLDKVFDPYFSTKIKKDGTGLGLYMSKTIIEDHCNGKLEIENTNEGALFRISIKKG